VYMLRRLHRPCATRSLARSADGGVARACRWRVIGSLAGPGWLAAMRPGFVNICCRHSDHKCTQTQPAVIHSPSPAAAKGGVPCGSHTPEDTDRRQPRAGARCAVRGARCAVRGARCAVRGARCAVRRSWTSTPMLGKSTWIGDQSTCFCPKSTTKPKVDDQAHDRRGGDVLLGRAGGRTRQPTQDTACQRELRGPDHDRPSRAEHHAAQRTVADLQRLGLAARGGLCHRPTQTDGVYWPPRRRRFGRSQRRVMHPPSRSARHPQQIRIQECPRLSPGPL
jgi:hypothetical protein